MSQPFVWEAWIGQKIVRAESLDDGTAVIVLEDGRGRKFFSDGEMLSFSVKDVNGPLWPETSGQ